MLEFNWAEWAEEHLDMGLQNPTPEIKTDHPEFVACFFSAIYQGNVGVLKELLIIPMLNIDVQDEHGMTGLGIAARNGNVAIARLLLEHKASINAIDQKGRTALLIGIMNQRVNITALLLANGADPDLAPNGQISPLTYTVFNSYYYTVELLLKHGANPNQKLRRWGSHIALTMFEGCCALYYAIQKNDTALCKLMLNYDASLDIDATNSPSPFVRAAYDSSSEITELLWNKLDDNGKEKFTLGAITHFNNEGLTYALTHVSDEIKQKVFHSTIGSVNPLSYTFNNNRSAFARLLLEQGHALLEKDKADDSAVVKAAKQSQKAAILYKVSEKRWRDILQAYLANMIAFENTPTLLEMTLQVVHRCASNAKQEFKDLGIPPELEEFYQRVPLTFDQRARHLKPQHVKEFLQNALAMPPEEVAANRTRITKERAHQKRAKK